MSKWYNQSEQNLVAIFTSYAAQARNRENVPVLLPNECDILQACQLEQEGSFEYHPASVGNVGFRMNDKG
ncbi:MAG: hypothetical protein KFH87_00545 [Bacteroidetes bacterium]|nr:hypothetical protein [Bacteroidota bacterium]